MLVTGCTGFVGMHCVDLLLRTTDFNVRGTVRRKASEKAASVLALAAAQKATGRLTLVEASLPGSPEVWTNAIKAVKYVLHVASPFTHSNINDPQKELYEPAIEGTLAVLRAANDKGSSVDRIVVTSSTAAIRIGHTDKSDDHVFTEEDWSNIEGPDIPPYDISKTMAERAAWKYMREATPGFSLVTMNPGMILGPLLGDKENTSLGLIKKLVGGEIPLVPPLQWTCVDVRDVAAAHIEAMVHATAGGERFILAHSSVTASQLCSSLAHAGYKKVPSWSMPYFLAWIGATMGSADMKYIKMFFNKRALVDGSKVESIGFKYKYSPLESALASAESLVEKGLV